MATFVLVRHKVRDFSDWKQEFDAHAPSRDEAGLSVQHLLRGDHDPNEVFILFAAQDLGRAKAMTESAELKEAMQRAGVVDRPDIYFLTE